MISSSLVDKIEDALKGSESEGGYGGGVTLGVQVITLGGEEITIQGAGE